MKVFHDLVENPFSKAAFFHNTAKLVLRFNHSILSLNPVTKSIRGKCSLLFYTVNNCIIVSAFSSMSNNAFALPHRAKSYHKNAFPKLILSMLLQSADARIRRKIVFQFSNILVPNVTF